MVFAELLIGYVQRASSKYIYCGFGVGSAEVGRIIEQSGTTACNCRLMWVFSISIYECPGLMALHCRIFC